MAAGIEIYFVHGWGCDGNVWHKWLPSLNKNVSYQIFDRGYFGRDKTNICLNATAARKVMIAHSFGLHLVPPEYFRALDLLVLVSSFRYFHEQSYTGKLSQKSIKLMKQRLEQDPLGLLQEFYLKCGLSNTKSPIFSSVNCQLLTDDLSLLDEHQIDLAQLKQIPKIILLHGGRDQIVSPEHSQLMHQCLPNSQLFFNDQAQHALPITQPRWCMQMIEENKKEFDTNLFHLAHTPASVSYTSITSNFTRRAASYDQVAHAQKYAASRLAARITRQFTSLSSTGSVLEIGSGTGLLSQHLLNLFPKRRIYFLDPARDMLFLCHKNLQHNSDCQFIESTIEDYFFDPEFSKAQYTLIASSFALHWLFDFKLVLDRLLERLAPAGQLFFSFPTSGSFPQWQNVCAQLNIAFTINPLPTLEDIKSAVDGSKATIDYEEYTCDVDFQNSLQFFQHMKMLGANTKKFNSDKQLPLADFRSLLKTWDSQPSIVLGKGNGKIISTYKILEGTITRR